MAACRVSTELPIPVVRTEWTPPYETSGDFHLAVVLSTEINTYCSVNVVAVGGHVDGRILTREWVQYGIKRLET